MAWLTHPNTGIGRINPDGNSGSCNACHVRHAIALDPARRPEHCGKCHMSVTSEQEATHDICALAARIGRFPARTY